MPILARRMIHVIDTCHLLFCPLCILSFARCPLGVFLKALCTFYYNMAEEKDKNIIAANLERPEYL